LDIWFQIRIEHQILNKMFTWMVIVVYIRRSDSVWPSANTTKKYTTNTKYNFWFVLFYRTNNTIPAAFLISAPSNSFLFYRTNALKAIFMKNYNERTCFFSFCSWVWIKNQTLNLKSRWPWTPFYYSLGSNHGILDSI
jgi:hypothetical protein